MGGGGALMMTGGAGAGTAIAIGAGGAGGAMVLGGGAICCIIGGAGGGAPFAGPIASFCAINPGKHMHKKGLNQRFEIDMKWLFSRYLLATNNLGA